MFQPIVPLTGFVGWKFLERTMESQKTAFTESTQFKRDTDYFREKIASITTAEELVKDRRLLGVALGAFGLDDDIGNKAFIRKILEDGTNRNDALANRLSDSRYKKFAAAFGFGNFAPRTPLTGFADEILTRYETKQFQRAVGEQNNDLRLAMNLGSELADLSREETSNDIKWFSVMGNTPLRRVFETALGFPSSFGRIDVDQQRTAFKERAEAVFGTDRIADFTDPDLQDKLIRLYLIRAEANAGATGYSGASAALTLLASAPRLYG